MLVPELPSVGAGRCKSSLEELNARLKHRELAASQTCETGCSRPGATPWWRFGTSWGEAAFMVTGSRVGPLWTSLAYGGVDHDLRRVALFDRETGALICPPLLEPTAYTLRETGWRSLLRIAHRRLTSYMELRHISRNTTRRCTFARLHHSPSVEQEHPMLFAGCGRISCSVE